MANDEIMRINESPFDKKGYYEKYVRDEPMEKVSFRIPKTAYNDLMKYFKGMKIEKSEGFKRILTDRLQMINSSNRTCFNNIELVMLLPKTNNLKEMNDKSHIIALYNTESDFDDSYVYEMGFNKKFEVQYYLRGFYEDFFPLEHFQMMNESLLFGVNFGDMRDWDSLTERLGELYPDLDMDDCYFVRFPLNNYLDVNRQGQFQHPIYMGKHQGLYIFDYLGVSGKRFPMIMDWMYVDGLMKFDCRFISMNELMEILRNSPYKNINECYENLKNSNHDKEVIKRAIENEEEKLHYLKRLYDGI